MDEDNEDSGYGGGALIVAAVAGWLLGSRKRESDDPELAEERSREGVVRLIAVIAAAFFLAWLMK